MSAELLRKLGIKAGHRVYARAECADLAEALAPHLPTRATFVGDANDPVNVVLLRPREDELDSLFGEARSWIVPDGAIWVVVKKKAYLEEGDPSFEAAQAAALPTGLVDNKECTVSDTEYATRYVIRKELRPKA